jgi:hypothetical protein
MRESVERWVGVLFVLCAAACSAKPGSSKAGAGDPKAAYEAVLKACRTKDGRALWAMADAGLKQQLEEEAKRVANAFGPKDLPMAFPAFKGKSSEFTGEAFLTASLHLDDNSRNPCGEADKWKVGGEGEDEDDPKGRPGYFVAVLRPGGLASGVRLVKQNGRWFLAEFTQTLDIGSLKPKEASSKPCSWTGKWRFELSWDEAWIKTCSGKRPPKSIVVDIKENADGKPQFINGTIPAGGGITLGKCSLVFNEKASGLASDTTLKLTFKEDNGVVDAMGEFRIITDRDGNIASVCGVDIAVKGSKSER